MVEKAPRLGPDLDLLAVAGDKAGLGQDPLLVLRKPRFLHGLAGVDQAREIFGNGIDALDNVMLDIALVGNANVLEPLTRYKAVGADETQHSREHLVAAGSVMRIDDDDFRRFRLADAPITTQAEHVLCVAEAVTVALANLATELHQVGGLQESLDAYSESLAVARAEVASGSSGAEAQAASVMSRVGDLRIALNDLEGALTVFSEQLDLRRAAVAAEPDSAELGLELGIAWANVGRVREARGEWDAAAHAYAESVQLRRAALEADPDTARFSGGLMFGLNCLGRVREAQRDQAGARRAFEESLNLARAQMRAHPGSMTAGLQLAVALNDVGRMHDAAGDLAGALRLFDEQLSMVRGMVDAQPGSAEVVRLLVVALTSVGVVRQADGDLDGAMEAFGESLELARERLAQEPTSMLGLLDAYVAWDNIATVHFERGDAQASRNAAEEAVAVARDLYETGSGRKVARDNLANSLAFLADRCDELGDGEAAARARTEGAVVEQS